MNSFLPKYKDPHLASPRGLSEIWDMIILSRPIFLQWENFKKETGEILFTLLKNSLFLLEE